MDDIKKELMKNGILIKNSTENTITVWKGKMYEINGEQLFSCEDITTDLSLITGRHGYKTCIIYEQTDGFLIEF